MARSLNKVQLIGRLGSDPQGREMGSGSYVANFSVATQRQWTGKDGQPHEETDWHFIVAWDKLGEICVRHLSKGRLVYVEGRLRTRSWDDGEQKHYKSEIVASDMLMLDTRDTPAAATVEENIAELAARGPAGKNRRELQPVSAVEDELPF